MEIKKYVKKPIVVEVIRWDGSDQAYDAIRDFSVRDAVKIPGTSKLMIKTLEGDHKATLGDYIIKGIKGEIYPCKPDIFTETYELYSEDCKSEQEPEETIPIESFDIRITRTGGREYRELVAKDIHGTEHVLDAQAYVHNEYHEVEINLVENNVVKKET